MTRILSSPAQAIWIAAALVVLFGCCRGAVRYERAIAALRVHVDQLRGQIALDTDAINQKPHLDRMHAKIVDDLRRTYAREAFRQSIPRFLVNVEGLTKRLGLEVNSIEIEPAAERAQESKKPDTLVPLNVDVNVTGGFGMILRFMQQITLAGPLVGVNSTDLSAGSRVAGAVQLRAGVHATLYRFDIAGGSDV